MKQCKFYKYNKLLVVFLCTYPFLLQAEIKQKNKDDVEDTIVVTSNNNHSLLLNSDGSLNVQISDNMPNSFGNVIRYQTLIFAPNVGQGVSSTGFDRGGYKGYNIRGLEGNRVGIDVNGIPLPDAAGRSYGSRTNVGTFGIGRDYIDPYMYRELSIQTGVSSANKSNGAIGGSVSFLSKSVNDYVNKYQNTYIGYQNSYDSTNKGFHNGLTFAGKGDAVDGLLVLSRSDSKQSKINNHITPHPKVSNSNALLMRGGWQADQDNLFVTTFDYYDRSDRNDYAFWKVNRNPALNERISAKQNGQTKRYSYDLAHHWSPLSSNFDGIDSRIFYQRTRANDKTTIFSNPAPYEYIHSGFNVNTYGIDSQSGFQWLDNHFTFGFNGLITATERPFEQRNVSTVRGEIMRPEADSRSNRFEAFFKNQFNLDIYDNNLAVEPGVRFVYQQTKAVNLNKMLTNNITQSDLKTLYGKKSQDSFILPSLLINYPLQNETEVYARYQRGVQFPNASQLYGSWNLNQNGLPPSMQYALVGNTHLEPETSHSFEVGFTGKPSQAIELGSAVFYNKYKNFIALNRYNRTNHPDMFSNVPSHVGVIYKTQNRDSAYIYGIEFNSKIDWSVWFDSLSGFDTVFSIGYSKGKSKSSYSGDKYVDLETVAPMKMVIGLNWNSLQENYGVSLTSTLQKGKQAKDSGRESYNNTPSSVLNSQVEYNRIPGYAIVDLSTYWQIVKNVRLNGGINNLTNKRYWDYSSSHSLVKSNVLSDKENFLLSTQPGRTFYLGMNIDF